MDPTAIVIGIVGLAALFLLPKLRGKQATSQIINLLLEHGATTRRNAKSREELGIPPAGAAPKEGLFGQGGIFGRTDYRVNALEELIKKEIVRQTNDRRLWLSTDVTIARTTK